MTYGEDAGTIRDELAALLCQHRIQQRLGGPGSHTVPQSTTPAEREHLGHIIQQYRRAALLWCRQALEAVSPKTDVQRTTTLTCRPLDELRHRLGRTLSADTSDLPLLDLLGTNHEFDLVTRWQRIARSAALGEHDFAADVNLGHLTPDQAITVAKDAADIIRGLVVLDRRYANIPGWTQLRRSGSLTRTAETVSRRCAGQAPDFSIDARGWRPALAAITGPALPGVAGAVQAQQNMLVDLSNFPHALNLRRLLHAQAQASHEAARHASSARPELVERFVEREQVYRTLVRRTRDVSGLAGGGGLAVSESQNVVTRLQRTSISGHEQGESLHELARLFTSTDARLASTIELGFHHTLYVLTATVPRMSDQQINGIFQPRRRWTPITAPAGTDIIPLVRERLRPAPVPPPAPVEARAGRQAYQGALTHRPEPREGRSYVR